MEGESREEGLAFLQALCLQQKIFEKKSVLVINKAELLIPCEKLLQWQKWQ